MEQFAGGKMMFTGETPLEEGGRTLHRLSFEPLQDGRVRHLWEASKDGGKTWHVVFDGTYVKKRAGRS